MKKNIKKSVLSWLLVFSMVFPLMSSVIYTQAAAGIKDYHAMSMEQIFDSTEPLTWVFAGDSITHNGSWSQGMNSYSEWFEQYLYDTGRGDDAVVLTAWGGADTTDFLKYDDTPSGNGAKTDPGMGIEKMITSYNPDVVFIKLGMNDRYKTTADFVKYYNMMLDTLYEQAAANGKKPKVVILTPTPMSSENIYDDMVHTNPDEDVWDSTLRHRNELKEIAGERGLLFCDLRTTFLNEAVKLGDDYAQMFFSDPSDGGIHPNAAGQYLIFKTLSKTLGIYDESQPIYQLKYEDLNNAALYVDGTNGVDYDNDYGLISATDDATEMNKDMLGFAKLLAAVDFNNTNGVFTSNNAYNFADGTQFDLTDESQMADALTLDEAKGLEKEFSIVFRAKLETPFRDHQAVLFLSPISEDWPDSVAVGVPGKTASAYYEIRQGGAEKTTSPNSIAISQTNSTVDGNWHTIAIVQSESSYTYYVDGEKLYSGAIAVKDGFNIGDLFANATDVVARIGSYSETNAASYHLRGVMDYYQFYKGALTPAQVKTLADNGGKDAQGNDVSALTDTQEMAATMPTTTETALSSVDFTSENGVFTYDSTNTEASTIDLTKAATGVDTLTVEEVQGIGTEYTIAFRARMYAASGRGNQPIFYLSTNKGTAFGGAEHNALILGAPGKSNVYYRVHQANKTNISTLGSTSTNYGGLGTAIEDGEWHTIVIVQSSTGMTYYVDGVPYTVLTGGGAAVKLNSNLGALFTNTSANTFDAAIGRYSTAYADRNWRTQGTFGYWQLYNVVLSNKSITALSAVGQANEMNAVMPTLDTLNNLPQILASVDLSSSNGTFVGGSSYAGATRVDLTDENVCTDPLTLEEAKGMKNEFSIVFRAKLETPYRDHQAIFFLSPTAEKWDDALSMGVQGSGTINYYEIRQGNAEKLSAANSFNVASTNKTVDGSWHTIAIVQSAESYTYYIDGEAIYTSNKYVVPSGFNIGDLFANATDVVAHVGSFSEEDAPTYNLKGNMDFYQLYGGALTAAQVADLTDMSGVVKTGTLWSSAVTENYVWTVAGAEQMSGYEGPVVNRSLFRFLDNAMRNGANARSSQRDIRMISAAAPGYTLDTMIEKYDSIIGRHNSEVFLLLPEISHVYAEGYEHSPEAVAAYKADVQALLDKSTAKVKILWTPLASGDDTINGYINDYADAVRQVAAADLDLLFFDANKFMNENMSKNEVLKRNWFEEDMYISPLCATDVARAFYALVDQPGIAPGELSGHNLRLTSDARKFKGNYVRDYVAANTNVSGTTVTVDISPITAAYAGLTNIRLVVLPVAGTGNYNDNLRELSEVTTVNQNGNVYTFEAPCADLNIAIYGEKAGYIYRFKDISLDVETDATISPKTVAEPDGVYLDSLEVVGAPAITLEENKTTYDVELYQYQQFVYIRPEAQEGLTIKVNGKEVKSGEMSERIDVVARATVNVTVSKGSETKTYTLNLTRPEYADIIITEVMTDGYMNYTKSGNDNYELIEIYNASGRTLNLLDYSVGYKKDYPYNKVDVTEGEYPYYFTGNNHAFSGAATHTGIKEITKYSSYWSNGDVTEPERVDFPADSTMVIWIKFSTQANVDDRAAYGAELTYDTLISSLEAHKGTNTLSVDIDGADTVVVPQKTQLVVAEASVDSAAAALSARANTKAEDSQQNFYLENHGAFDGDSSTRSWLFILKDTATVAQNGAVTDAGDDIVSAAKYIRPGSTNKRSSVFSYNVDRGMSLVKNETTWTDISKAYTSDVQGYSNYTSFGAIEYWQKPTDFGDDTKPTVENNTPKAVVEGAEATIDLTLKDNEDVRYMELYVKKAGETAYTKITEDFVLESGVTKAGLSTDITSKAYTYALGAISDTAQYYGFVIDGNNNKTTFGTESSPLTVTIGDVNGLTVNMAIKDEDGKAAADTVKAEVEITLEQGTAEIALGDSYDVVDSSVAKVGTVTKSGNKLVGTIELKNGDAVSIKGLPQNVKYTVKVTVPDGYKADAESANGTIGSTAAVVNLSLQEKADGDLKVDVTIKDEEGKAAAASVEATVAITVEKGTATEDFASSYDILVDGTKAGTLTLASGKLTGTVTVSNGESVSIVDIPEGATYKVDVTLSDEYRISTTNATGTIDHSQVATVSAALQERPEADFGVDVVIKDEDGNAAAASVKATVAITVEKGTAADDFASSYDIMAGTTKVGTLTLASGKLTGTVTASNGEFLSVADLPVGATYKVDVTMSDEYRVTVVDGTGSIELNKVEIAEVTAQEKPEGDLYVNVSIKDEDGAAVADTVKATVAITVEKGTAVDDLANSYDILVDGTKAGTLTLASGKLTGTVEVKNGSEISVEDLPEGAAYTVKATLSDDYNVTVTDGTGTIDHRKSSDVTVSVQEKEKTYGALKLTMSVVDKDSNEVTDVEVTVKVTLTNAKSVEIYTMKSGDVVDIKDILTGTTYTVDVTVPEGYELKTNASALTGTIAANTVTPIAIDLAAKAEGGEVTPPEGGGTTTPPAGDSTPIPPTSGGSTSSPTTGDNTQVWLYVVLILVACTAVATVVYVNKRRHMNERF